FEGEAMTLAQRSVARARTKRLAGAALLGAALFASVEHEARAQNTNRIAAGNGDGMDLHLFRPAVDSKGFFSVNGSDVLGANGISLGLVLDYGHDLMALRDGHSTDYLVHHAFQGTFQFNYGIMNRLVVGISAPVVLNTGDDATDIGPTGRTYDDDKL